MQKAGFLITRLHWIFNHDQFSKAILPYLLNLYFPGFPNGLSIDYVANRLYWVDAKLDKVETSTLNGNNKVTLIHNVPHPFGLAVVSCNLIFINCPSTKIECSLNSILP